MKMFIFKLAKTESDRRSVIISYPCVRQVRAGTQTQVTDECQPSLKRNQLAKRWLSLFPLLSIFQFSNNTILVSFPPRFLYSFRNTS